MLKFKFCLSIKNKKNSSVTIRELFLNQKKIKKIQKKLSAGDNYAFYRAAKFEFFAKPDL